MKLLQVTVAGPSRLQRGGADHVTSTVSLRWTVGVVRYQLGRLLMAIGARLLKFGISVDGVDVIPLIEHSRETNDGSK